MSVIVGDEQSALLFFVFYSVIGLVLGAIVFALFAFRGSRRPQFRHLGVMPRFGATAGISIALVISYVAWSAMYRDFYRIDVDDETVQFQYFMPSQVRIIPKSAVTSVEKRAYPGRGGRYRILMVTEGGVFSSARMYSNQFDGVWEAISAEFPTR